MKLHFGLRNDYLRMISSAFVECLANVLGLGGIGNVGPGKDSAGFRLAHTRFASFDGLDVESVHAATVLVHLQRSWY